MPIDPFLAPMVGGPVPLSEPVEDFAAARVQWDAESDALFSQVAEPGPDVRVVEVRTIPVDRGEIDLRIYYPEAVGDLPVHMFLHGGGWIAGTVHGDFTDAACRERCVGAECVVVAVNYRKAPEHKAPVPLEDCYVALLWIASHADELGVRLDRLTIGGQSAGANLGAALALKVRDENGPAISFALFEVPCFDLHVDQPSHTTLAHGYGFTPEVFRMLRELYTSSPSDIEDPYVSPLLAPDLAGFPPSYVMSAEYDPLRDDGERFVERLTEAGIPATFSLQAGHMHGSASFTKAMESARAWRAEVLRVLQKAHRI